MNYQEPKELKTCLQVLYGVLDLDDSLGDVRRQLAYEESQGDGQGDRLADNGGGLFATMSNLYTGWDDTYDTTGYHKNPSDSEYVHPS